MPARRLSTPIRLCNLPRRENNFLIVHEPCLLQLHRRHERQGNRHTLQDFESLETQKDLCIRSSGCTERLIPEFSHFGIRLWASTWFPSQALVLITGWWFLFCRWGSWHRERSHHCVPALAPGSAADSRTAPDCLGPRTKAKLPPPVNIRQATDTWSEALHL